MMHTAKPGTQLTVLAGERSRQIRGGDVVDFDEVIVPARKDRPAETLREVLGAHADTAFEAVAEPETFSIQSVSFDHAAAPASEE